MGAETARITGLKSTLRHDFRLFRKGRGVSHETSPSSSSVAPEQLAECLCSFKLRGLVAQLDWHGSRSRANQIRHLPCPGAQGKDDSHGRSREERQVLAFPGLQVEGRRVNCGPAMRDNIRIVSSAGTGFTYYKKKNKRTMTSKLELKKYDPVVRKHVVFKEAKMPPHSK